jgi:hypothetical protein
MTITAAVLLLTALLAVWVVGRRKTVDRVVLGEMRRKRQSGAGTKHLFFCFVDHYEPLWQGAGRKQGLERVQVWRDRYGPLVSPYRDNGGTPPQHAFFYPEEEYDPEYLGLVADICRDGFGDVEIHLHHHNDTSENLRRKLLEFKNTLRRDHGLLHSDPSTGEPVYAFIHGNWALHNSDRRGEWCGVDDELTVLRETGCYADFTYPSAPHHTQPPITNRIYYATGDPDRPKSFYRGVDAAYGTSPGGHFLLVNGPLVLNWKSRKLGLLPRIENGDVTAINPATPRRVDMWVNTGIAVRDWPNWLFVKVHTHGAKEANATYLLSEDGAEMYRYLLDRYNDGRHYVLHFITPWQLYRCVKILESGDREAIESVQNFTFLF